MISYIDADFIETTKAALPVASDVTGTFRGYRIFTACHTVRGQILGRDWHIERLYHSARSIFMADPVSRPELEAILDDLIQKNAGDHELLLQIIFSGGEADSTGVNPVGNSKLYIIVNALKPLTEAAYQTGVRLATYPHQRPIPTLKPMNYLGAIIAHQTVVKEHNATYPLFVSPEAPHLILEGSTYSFFGVKNNTLLTPPLDGHILDGITRRFVLEVAQKQGVPVLETKIPKADILTFDEAFLTSSTRGILAVTKIDTHTLTEGEGALTHQLRKGYQSTYL
ncbi:MAG: aminotransferase class IV [Candidatus Margulisiibacteriota bacterium]